MILCSRRCNLNDAFFFQPHILMKSFIVYWHAIVFAVGLQAIKLSWRAYLESVVPGL